MRENKPPQVKGNLPTRTPGSLSCSNPHRHAGIRHTNSRAEYRAAHTRETPRQQQSIADGFTHVYSSLSYNVFWLLLLTRAAQQLSSGLFSVPKYNVKLFILTPNICTHRDSPPNSREGISYSFWIAPKNFYLVWQLDYHKVQRESSNNGGSGRG